MRKYSWIVLLASLPALAGNAAEDFFYSNQKIYVVVAILVIIFILLAFYLKRLDGRITKLEKENEA